MEQNSVGVISSDQGQKDAFLNELSQFLSDKGRYVCRTPNLAGRTVDLHDLYNKVTSAGGYQKVTERGYWEDFLEYYGYPAISSTLAYGMQRIYQLYLEDYERVHFFGDDEPQPYFRSFPGRYRRFRYPISESQRVQCDMNMRKPSVSDYDRVVLSLESCLPNEIDFAVNACTLLSGESRHVLKLPQCRRIVDALLMHAGIVSNGFDSYREVLEELQNKTKHNYRKFWNNSIAKKSVLSVLIPVEKDGSIPQEEDGKIGDEESTVTPLRDLEVEEVHSEDTGFADALQKRLHNIQKSDSDNNTPGKEYSINAMKRSKWSELFHGHRSLGVQDYEGQRVLQIALVLLNLSFEDFNVTLLARHSSLVRFVFLCIHSEYSCLRQTGLDILSNISSHMQILHLHYDMVTMIFDTIHAAVLSSDKFERIRGFEILGNISRPRPNVDHVCVSVRDDVYEAAAQNLMINDVELLLSAIEALYRLSKLGETTCTKIIFIKGCIDVLVCLVTLNVRTFGSEKLSEIRLARKIIPGQPETQQHPQQQQTIYQLPGQQAVHHPNHAAIVQRQIHYQQHQQQKLGSVHQAQPTYAVVASSIPPSITALAINQTKPPLPPQQQQTYPPLRVQPKPEPVQNPLPVTPVKPPAQVVQTQQPSKVPQALPAPVLSPPPRSSTTSPVTKSSPPGAGPTYTHSETGTVPPVFHYMPAPPTDIVQDNSPESFTKLWIWATYESESESYIPRVDVYCEYLASSNRYGRQGKTEILSATDFGKCLKQIFPIASSRLFNQGRGQPQYHIAGIKKRATPLPVPGYQLKDPTSVFSSEYEKMPALKPQAPVTVLTTSQPALAPSTPLSANQPAVTVPAQMTTTVSAIPQLQFQPILIVSTLPCTSVALVPSTQLTAATVAPTVQAAIVGQSTNQNVAHGITDQNMTLSGQAVADTSHSVTLSSQTVALVCQDVTSSGLSVTEASRSMAPPSRTVVSVCQNTAVTSQMPAPTFRTVDPLTPSGRVAPVGESMASVAVVSAMQASAALETSEKATQQLVSNNTLSMQPDFNNADTTDVNVQNRYESKQSTNESSNDNSTNEMEIGSNLQSESDPPVRPGATISRKHNSTKNGMLDGVQETEDPTRGAVINGYLESEATEKGTTEENEHSTKSTMMEIDEALEEVSKPHKVRTKSRDSLVNGFDENSTLVTDTKMETSRIKNNGPGLNGTSLNDDASEKNDLMNGETEAAVNSILDSSDANVDEFLSIVNSSTEETQPGAQENNATASDCVASVSCTVEETSCSTSEAETSTLVQGTTAMPHNSTSATTVSNSTVSTTNVVLASPSPNVTPCASMTPTNVTLNPGEQNTTTMTPTNPIPHSALNQRLKDTITKRMNSQLTPSTMNVTPTNSLPPSVIQQYSYKQESQVLAQQIIPITPHQLQQQYNMQRHQTTTHNHISTPHEGTLQVVNKRPLPQSTAAISVPPAKVARPSLPTSQYTPSPQPYGPQYHPTHLQSQVVAQTPRHMVPTLIQRPPHPQLTQQHQIAPGVIIRPNTPLPNPHLPGSQPKPKPPTIDLMAPNASLLVLYRNVGKIPFTNHMDEKEDAISKSVRLTAALILRNIARYSDLGRSILQKHEENLANVAMSQMDCSPIVARLLGELDV